MNTIVIDWQQLHKPPQDEISHYTPFTETTEGVFSYGWRIVSPLPYPRGKKQSIKSSPAGTEIKKTTTIIDGASPKKHC